MATTRRADLDNHIVDNVLAPSLNTLYSDLTLTRLVRNVSEEARNQGASSRGDKVKFPIRGAVTASTKTAGTASTPTRYTDAEKAELEIDTLAQVHYLVEDDATAFAQVEAMSGYAEDAAHALAEKMDTDLFALYASAGTTTVYTDATGLTPARLAAQRKLARDAKWMSNKPSFAVIGPRAAEDLETNTTIVNHNSIESISRDALVDSRVARIHGFDIYVSNLAPDITGSPGYENNLLFQPDAMAIAFADMDRTDVPEMYKPQGVLMRGLTLNDDSGNAAYSMRAISGYNLADRGPEIVFDTLYGVKVIRSELLFNVQV